MTERTSETFDVRLGRSTPPELIQNVTGQPLDFATRNLPMNLEPFGGVNGVYRFALVKKDKSSKSVLIIELVSDVPSRDWQRTDLSSQQERFDSFGFHHGIPPSAITSSEINRHPRRRDFDVPAKCGNASQFALKSVRPEFDAHSNRRPLPCHSILTCGFNDLQQDKGTAKNR